jgi:putative transposase
MHEATLLERRRKQSMSLPRQVVAGRSYMITRRCTQRTFLLRPDAETNNAFIYCLGVAAKRTGVKVMFFLAMSNHYHAGIIDKAGRLPEFLETFHKFMAKHQNALRRRWENFWASEQTSVVELIEPNDVIEKMIYTLTNPVKAQLVERADQWPGATSLRANLRGSVVHAHRPARFFRKEGPLPDTVTILLARPPDFGETPQSEFARHLSERITMVEADAARERSSSARRIVGRGTVRRQDWRERPQTAEVHGGLDPRVAAHNKWRRVEALRRNRTFIDAYRAARDLWLKGTSIIFPPGTYWLRRFGGVACVPDDVPS